MAFEDDEIRRHVRETAGKRKNADYDRMKLMNELKMLAARGDEAEFEAKLAEAGMVEGSEQWRKAKSAFQAFRQLR